METINEVLTWLWSLAGVKFIVAHTAINVAFAIAAALKAGDFALCKTPEFLWRKLLPLVLVYGSVRAAGNDANLGYLAPVAFAMIEAALLADLVENMSRLGIPVPERVATLLRKNAGATVIELIESEGNN